jgi:hypothetical protein
MPGDLSKFWYEIKSSSCQSRHVQRLTDMANVIRSPAVLVDKSASTSEIQESNAA